MNQIFLKKEILLVFSSLDVPGNDPDRIGLTPEDWTSLPE